jgi:hypothetical protein
MLSRLQRVAVALAVVLMGAMTLTTMVSSSAGAAPKTTAPKGATKVYNPGGITVWTTVTNCNDSGSGSLPYVVANGPTHNIDFSPSLPCSTIDLPNGPIVITGFTAIEGPGATDLALSGGGVSQLFSVDGFGSLSISGLTLENASTPDDGGAISNLGTLTVQQCTFSNNSAQTGGVIANDQGSTTIQDSTLSGNMAENTGGVLYNNSDATMSISGSSISASGSPQGGGIYNVGTLTVSDSTFNRLGADYLNGGAIENEQGTLTVSNSSFFDDQADLGDGGAIYDAAGATASISNSTFDYGRAIDGADVFGPVSLTATIVSYGSISKDCAGGVVDDGYNIDDDGSCGLTAPSISDSSTLDASLGTFENNGGATNTIPLLPGSPAIDVVPTADCPSTDQRGDPRTPPCDVGAYDTDGGTGAGPPAVAPEAPVALALPVCAAVLASGAFLVVRRRRSRPSV